MACSLNNKKHVFDKYLDSLKESKLVSRLKSDLKDSVQSWIDKRLNYVLFLQKTNWQIDDAIFFNNGQTKALLLLLIQPLDDFAPNDYVKIIAAEEINQKWRYYFASYPVIDYNRDKSKANLYKVLAENSRDELIDDGFVECKPKCRINYQYVDSDLWFADWRREMHIQFLNNTLGLMPDEKPGEQLY